MIEGAASFATFEAAIDEALADLAGPAPQGRSRPLRCRRSTVSGVTILRGCLE